MKKSGLISVERLLLLIIMLTAAFLRFWDFTAIPFMHDEFSALFRAQYNTFGELIRKGVLPDAHPPGVQVLIYFFVKLFGMSEPVLKFPFLLMGVGSVYFVYLVGKKWFGTATALLSAALITVLQYNIFYSQIIRPYEPGLFFGLGAVYFWTKIVFDKQITKWDQVWFVVFLTVNSYIHAFSLLLNLMLGVTGLYFVDKKNRWPYIRAGIISFLLFLPGFKIFWLQLKRGDIGGWLGKPGYDFLVDYFEYIFHYSGFFFSVVFLAAGYLAFKNFNFNRKAAKFRWIAFLWFVITFLIAFFYSVWRIPVIQFSTLYFVFPFLVMLFFSFVGKVDDKRLALAVFLILFSGTSTLVLDREHYRLMYHQGLNEIPKLVLQDLETDNQKNHTAVVLQAPQTKMFDFYFKKYGKKPDYFKLEHNDQLPDALRYLKSQPFDRVIIGIADYAPLTFLETVKSYFPEVIKRETSQNMEYWVLGKNNPGKEEEKKFLQKQLSAVVSFTMKEPEKYKGGIILHPDSLNFDDLTVLNLKAEVVKDSVIPDALLVVDWKTGEGKNYFWAGSALPDFYPGGDSVYVVTFSSRMRNFRKIPKGSEIKIYFWKKDRSLIRVKKLQAYFTKMDAVEFGLFRSLRR